MVTQESMDISAIGRTLEIERVKDMLRHHLLQIPYASFDDLLTEEELKQLTPDIEVDPDGTWSLVLKDPHLLLAQVKYDLDSGKWRTTIYDQETRPPSREMYREIKYYVKAREAFERSTVHVLPPVERPKEK